MMVVVVLGMRINHGGIARELVGSGGSGHGAREIDDARD